MPAPPSREASTPWLPLLLILFVGSGCAALIYEIVWFQMLQLAIGSSAVSLGVLLGVFMGGMCLGSAAFARIVPRDRHPLRIYAGLELGIGALGLVLLRALPWAGDVYTALAPHGTASILLRAAVCALCLLPPTMLMGATLPAIARWMKATPAGVSHLGFFYGANIAGAVFGCLLAGFYLLRLYDVESAGCVAVAINVVVAAVGFGLARITPYASDAEETAAPKGERSVYIVIGLSGMAALAAEVVWTRLLSLLLGATVYTFSIILAVFLVGLGVGSSLGSMFTRERTSSRLALGLCQLGLVFAVAWAGYALNESLPYWPIDVSLSRSPWTTFQLDVIRCVWAVLPAACLWGASFPLALAAAASEGQDPAELAGRVYAANTAGAITGALLSSMVMIAAAGTRASQQIVAALAALAALIALAPLVRRARLSGALGLAAVALAALSIISLIPGVPPGLVGYGRYLATYFELPDFLYVTEGMNASLAVSELPEGVRNFHVSGKVVASSEPQDMRLQRMLGHLPALVHTSPKTVLVVGCGAGVTAGSFVAHPDVERIVICEIEPRIPPAARQYFAYENHGVLDDPRVEIIYDDARHFIATTDERFDVITSDPIHPWVKGAAALYSLEYFDLCKRRLTSDGVVAQWVPLYESNAEAVNSQIGTFMTAFPGGTIWSNDAYGDGYDLVLLGQDGPTAVDVEALRARLARTDHDQVRRSLEEVEFGSPLDLLKTYAGRGADLGDWIDQRLVNLDRNMRLQYLAGLGLNLDQADAIYTSLLQHRRYPEGLFTAGAADEETLRSALGE